MPPASDPITSQDLLNKDGTIILTLLECRTLLRCPELTWDQAHRRLDEIAQRLEAVNSAPRLKRVPLPTCQPTAVVEAPVPVKRRRFRVPSDLPQYQAGLAREMAELAP